MQLASMHLTLLLPAVAAANAGAAGRPWVPRFLKEYPLAICNDGSPAAYYHRVGMEGSRRWVVYLDGVGWCWDGESCAHPWQRDHGTSNVFPKTAEQLAPRANRFLQDGLFDPIRSPLADAHIAFVKSCSNDAFMGDRSPVEPVGLPFAQRRPEQGWHFRGRRIVEAVFADLRKHTGLGAQMGDRVIYGGCSAGARGAMVSIDHIAGSEAIVGKAGVVGLLDSGLWVPISPKTNSVDWDSFGHQMRAALELTNATAFLDDACQQKYPGEERWKCLMAAYRLPFVRTPYFLVHSQYDLFALSMNLWGHYWVAHKFSRMDLAWAENYRKMIVEYLPRPSNHSGTVIYSPACYMHCIVTVPKFWTTTADGAGLADTMRMWLTVPDTSKLIFEKCNGFNCGNRKAIRVRSLRALPEPANASEPVLTYHEPSRPPVVFT
mmetsp:Transcript_37464/g.116406  ORF Transcript_37464/g.116406 Transcript_37464/m.116406 type:complete len:434 (-) Transcript_37464:129-1430(-)